MNSVQNMLKANPERSNPFTNDRPGPRWFRSFMKRHQEISVRTPERVSKARAGVTEDAIRKWFTKLRENLTEMNALDVLENPDRIFNSDETCMQLAPTTGKVLGMRKWKNIYEVSPGPEKSNLTFLGTFSASGKIPTPMIIYPCIRLRAEIGENVPDHFLIGKSESGWMKTETFYEFLGKMHLMYSTYYTRIQCDMFTWLLQLFLTVFLIYIIGLILFLSKSTQQTRS